MRIPVCFSLPGSPALTLGSPVGRNVLPKLREKHPSSSQSTRGRSLRVPVAGPLLSLLPPSPVLRPAPAGEPFAVAATLTFKTLREKRENLTLPRGREGPGPESAWVTSERATLEKVISYSVYELVSPGCIPELRMC